MSIICAVGRWLEDYKKFQRNDVEKYINFEEFGDNNKKEELENNTKERKSIFYID